jgi:hypothetical protein
MIIALPIISMIVAQVVIALSLPLFLGRIPKNALYGFRLTGYGRWTDAEWLAVNRRGGLALLLVGIVFEVLSIILLVLTFTTSIDQQTVIWLNLGLTVVLIIGVLKAISAAAAVAPKHS